jgi:hypothetical protein
MPLSVEEIEAKLPAPVQAVVIRLRRHKPQHVSVLERLLAKWEAGDREAKERVEHLILALGRPNRMGLVLTIVFSLVAAVLGYHFYSESHLRTQVANGTRAVAQVTQLNEGFCVLGSKSSQCLALSLVVHAQGHPPFEATLTRDLSAMWLSRVQPGSWVVVAIDPSDPRIVYLDEGAFSRPPPSVPVDARRALPAPN